MLCFSLFLSPSLFCFSSSVQIILCFSPVGSTLRVRARKFPAIVNCTAIDWFHEWPQEALESVSRRFIEEMPGIKVQNFKLVNHMQKATQLSVRSIMGQARREKKNLIVSSHICLHLKLQCSVLQCSQFLQHCFESVKEKEKEMKRKQMCKILIDLLSFYSIIWN